MVIELNPIDVDLWWTTLDATDARAKSLLSDDERMRADRYRDRNQRERWIASRGFLRQVLGQYVHKTPAELQFEPGEFGKPVLVGHPSVHFSLSHAGDVAIAAANRVGPLGVDIEPIRSISDLTGIATISLTPREREVLQACPEEEQPCWFLHAWTRKEALLKACGERLGRELTRIEVSLEPNSPCLIAWEGRLIDRWSLMAIDNIPGSLGALAMETPAGVRLRINSHRWPAACGTVD